MNIGPGDTLMAVTIGSETSTAQARVYIDDVRLICVGTGVPVAAPVAAPVRPPVAAPVAAPVRPPVVAPVAVPVAAPVKPPTIPPVSPPVAPPGFAWAGINIAGAEFGGYSFWPTTQDMDYFAGKGMNVFRVPFEWTRMQPILSQPLDATEIAGLDAVVQYATVTKGVYVIIDPHKYVLDIYLILVLMDS